MKKFLALALSLCLFGCATSSRTPAPTTPPISAQVLFYSDLYSELTPFMVPNGKMIVMDSMFAALPEDLTRRLIAESLIGLNLNYIPEAYDCEDEALTAVLRLRALYRREENNAPIAAPVGLIGVAILTGIPELKIPNFNGTIYHALMLVRVQGGKYLLVEPTMGTITEFSSLCYEGVVEPIVIIF